MQRAVVVTEWCNDGPAYRYPCIDADYSLEVCHDVTLLHPDVQLGYNEMIAEVVTDAFTLAAIDADPKYRVISQEATNDIFA